MPDKELLEKYAEVALRTGVNIQKDQPLFIMAPIDGADFVRLIAKRAYELGASEVHINWSDDTLMLLKYEHQSEEVLTDIPDWLVEQRAYYMKKGAALLQIRSTDPDLLKDVDGNKVAQATKATAQALQHLRHYTMNDIVPWTIITIPTDAWAQKIFPGKSAEEATKLLWDSIFKIVRVDQDDPIQAWKEHNATLHNARDVLNGKRYKKVHFKSEGTDLTIGLPEGHIWKGGSSTTESGTEFNPNMPTEEVFTMPHKYDVDGTVTSKKPLIYDGNMIDNFTLTFKEGKVVDYKAEVGQETLKHLLETDEGALRLGEVALVPHESPISQSGLIFYNTLYDENASCHVALGKAYPTTLEGGASMNAEELDKHGVNDSLTHTDFMIGSADLSIDGIFADDSSEPVFRDGSWAIKFD
ncbi:peptidase M29 [Terribacillus saccharophilus]|uniref:Peptidase M29 n=1 Tax=Terribacillus saccharophilus TaxID=361277 RepID=A0A075LTP8_9BACI|nr:aminopeptidase [Terribacillus goriensis]AIF67808.1 peptidase M29 [Terribacillus goriensis]